MSAPFFGRAGRELFKAASRPPRANRVWQAIETPPPRKCGSRSFASRAAVRQSAPRTAPKPYPKPNPKPNPTPRARVRTLPVLAASTGLLTLLFTVFQPVSHESIEVPAQTPPAPSAEAPIGDGRGGLPRYRLSEIKEHGPNAERPWVIYEDKVYDITDWVAAHPGGEVILRAAGGCIEPYWDIFSIHKSQYVRDILAQYVVGQVHSDDLDTNGRPLQNAVEDPFVSDPKRDARLRRITEKPCNAETPGDELAESFLTPNETFYVRNHMWVPVIDEAEADRHNITIELPDGEVKTYSVGELKARFRQHSVTAVLQCSGNRRNDMTRLAKKTNGLQWTVGAISCAKWEGVRLRDVLADAGLSLAEPGEDARHVQFSGLEAYGASIPIEAAIDPRGDVLLAFKMNDQVLPRDHGFPVRVVVPGHVAARAVKWVNKIVVADEESTTTWQRKDYKCFGPNETKQDWDKYKSIQVMPITSAITRTRLRPEDGETASRAKPEPRTSASGRVVQIEGYAYSGGGREIQRVDISLDGGATWDQAKLLDDTKQEKGSQTWCWKRWTYEGVLPEVKDVGGEAKTTFVVKATDDAYNTQPESHKSIYNLRGNLATAWHRVEFDCKTGDCWSERAKQIK